jgi:transposase
MDGVKPPMDVEALVALVAELRRELAALRAENDVLRRRVAELEGRGGKPTAKTAEPYSLRAEERRRVPPDGAPPGSGSTKERQASVRRGRVATAIKIEQADINECLFPEGLTQRQCEFHRTRVVWRVREGRAVRVGYELWRGPRGEEPVIEGVSASSEFAREIHLGVAYLSLIVGLSLDKVCQLVKFFWQLELSKSQANALLNQLSREWESEFDTLCTLLAHSAVVHADETSWSLNSVWALLSEQSRLLVFGCRKDAETLEILLPKTDFAGTLCSDDAAIYRGFTRAQKCWAHLLRKAIKFTLLDPENATYRRILDELLSIYRAAKATSLNTSLTPAERVAQVELLTRRLCQLLGEFVVDEASPPAGTIDRDFHNLMHELSRLSLDEELFTFVIHPAATGTNNEAERSLRQSALDRRTGRTSKTPRGARRRSILTSVLESVKLHLPQFTLTTLTNEIARWHNTGQSLFTKLLNQSGLTTPNSSVLDLLYPKPT